MLHRRIEPKEASALLYAMQVASVNLGILSANKNQNLISQTAPSPSPVIAAENIPSPPTSSEPKPLPPGTIQASAQSRRRPPSLLNRKRVERWLPHPSRTFAEGGISQTPQAPGFVRFGFRNEKSGRSQPSVDCVCGRCHTVSRPTLARSAIQAATGSCCQSSDTT
jgi:hypothetical protein